MGNGQITTKGEILRISGPVVIAENLDGKMYDVVRVGKEQLMGEIIEIDGNTLTIQVYENTSGLKPGDIVETTQEPLSVELGPGLLGKIFDGVQRPLDSLQKETGNFIERGAKPTAIDYKQKWDFMPSVKKGDAVKGGDVLGIVKETENIAHKILLPPTMKGKIKTISKGKFTVTEKIAELDTKENIYLKHNWPVRKQRPFTKKLHSEIPLITGQRIFDTFFPLAKGGTAAIPGPFGAGKTVSQQSLAKWSDADIIVYIGCGERGNEMTEVLTEFPHLKDPKTSRPLMERTILIANTSNMPVAAREASIYTGITIAEYYRDQGYNVALMADSTSRWAEAMREISSRLEEMPGEEGYPAYIATRLAQFYERAGRTECIGNPQRIGSITSIGAVSPPGGDFSEPVTQNTLKVTKVFWALDAKLAQRRHFPSINWLNSYSLYLEDLKKWFEKDVNSKFPELRANAMKILQKEAELQEIVQLVGSESIPEKERVILETAKLLREGFLQQNAFHEIDAYCSMKKQFGILNLILKFHSLAKNAIENQIQVEEIENLQCISKIVKSSHFTEEEFEKEIVKIEKEMESEFNKLLK